MAFMTTAAIASNSNDDDTPHPRLPTTTTTHTHTHHSNPPTTSEAALAAAGLLSTTSFSTNNTNTNNSNGTETMADHEIDAIIARIGARHAIAGYLIVDLVERSVVRSQMVGSDGRVLFGRRTGRRGGVEGEGEGETEEEESAEELVGRYAEMCVKFVDAATELSDQFFEQEDGLKLLRLRTVQHELIIIPDPRFVLVVIHDLHR